MQPTKKNNPIEAELSFSYLMHPDQLMVKDAQQAHALFNQIWQHMLQQDGWYVLFLSAKNEFKCWHHQANFLDIAASAKSIMGTAIAINAKQVIVARIDIVDHAKLSQLDILWLIELIKNGQKKKIKLKDYLVIALKNWCHYEEDEWVN